MDATQAYADRIDAVSNQRTRLHEGERQDDSWGGAMARRFQVGAFPFPLQSSNNRFLVFRWSFMLHLPEKLPVL